eukprot:4024764-Ditylum_brightwellii.AAC.1
MGYQSSRVSSRWRESKGIAFVNNTHPARNMRCFRCNRMGHYACSCTTPAEDIDHGNEEDKNGAETVAVTLGHTRDEAHLNYNEEPEFTWCLIANALIHLLWILLDNQSTVEFFCNAELLTIIHEVEKYVTVKQMEVSYTPTRWKHYQGMERYGSAL